MARGGSFDEVDAADGDVTPTERAADGAAGTFTRAAGVPSGAACLLASAAAAGAEPARERPAATSRAGDPAICAAPEAAAALPTTPPIARDGSFDGSDAADGDGSFDEIDAADDDISFDEIDAADDDISFDEIDAADGDASIDVSINAAAVSTDAIGAIAVDLALDVVCAGDFASLGASSRVGEIAPALAARRRLVTASCRAAARRRSGRRRRRARAR